MFTAGRRIVFAGHSVILVAARDLASRQIRVVAIAPGVFDTPMLARLRPDIREALEQSVPHPSRLGAPDDYARMAVSRELSGSRCRQEAGPASSR